MWKFLSWGLPDWEFLTIWGFLYARISNLENFCDFYSGIFWDGDFFVGCIMKFILHQFQSNIILLIFKYDLILHLILVDLGQSLIKLQKFTLKRPRSVAVPTKGKKLLNFKNFSKKLRYNLELKILKKPKSTSDFAKDTKGH